MSSLASLAPNWRLIADSNRSPACEATESTSADQATSIGATTAAATDHGEPLPATAAERAADRARPGLLRADRRRKLRPAERAAGEISRDVGRPHHREQEQDRGEAERRDRRAARSARAAARRHRCSAGDHPAARMTPSAIAPSADARSATSRVHSHSTIEAAATVQNARSERRQPDRHQAIAECVEPAPARSGRRDATPRARDCCARGSAAPRARRIGTRPRAQDPVLATSPPNRRSRRRYSAIASSSAARSKSGQ